MIEIIEGERANYSVNSSLTKALQETVEEEVQNIRKSNEVLLGIFSLFFGFLIATININTYSGAIILFFMMTAIGFCVALSKFETKEIINILDSERDILSIGASTEQEPERIIIKPDILRQVCDEIISKYSQINSYTKIGEKLGIHSNISRVLRGELSLSFNAFNRLQKLYGKPIHYEEKIGHQTKITLEKNEDTAAFVAIILGDGHLVYKKQEYRLNIALNGVDEYPIVVAVKDILQKLFSIEIKEQWASKMENANGDEKVVYLDIRTAAIVRAVLDLGLTAGNKVENQVKVPSWIFQNGSYRLNCIKWLTDTDGSIYVDSYNKNIRIVFVNSSRPLVKDYKKLCSLEDIRTGSVNGPYFRVDPRTGSETLFYSVQIVAKNEVKKFLQLIKPLKWQIKYNDIGNKLTTLGVGRNIDEAIENLFIYKIIHYTREYAEYLKNLFIELGGYRNIERYFEKENISQSLSRRSMPIFLKKYFNEEDIIDVYGVDAYNKWKYYNSNILIDNSSFQLIRFPLHLRKEFCKTIFDILNNGKKITNGYVLKGLKRYIDFVDLNNHFIDDIRPNEDVIIYKLERIAFLWNHPNYCTIITGFFIQHIEFVRDLIRFKNKDVYLSHFHRKYPLLGEIDNIKEIIVSLTDSNN